MTFNLLGKGVYPPHLAARLAGCPAATVRRRFRGDRRLFELDFADVDGEWAMSFHNLIELAVAVWLRAGGESIRRIRARQESARRVLETAHPFCHARYPVPGPLQSQFDHDPATGLARRWRIRPGVVLDPAYCFGRPIVEGAWITTRVLAGAGTAEGSAVAAARWYEVESAQVEAAVAFERWLEDRRP